MGGALILAAAARPVGAQVVAHHVASAETFGVLGGAVVVNTGSTIVAGDVGVAPGGVISGTAITITAGGDLHQGDAVARQAQLDALETYSRLEQMTCTTNLTGQNLGGRSLSSGVYCFDGDASLTGTALTLTGSGPWIFRVGGNLNASAPVTLPATSQACNSSNLFWVVGEAVTIATNTAFAGTVLAWMNITLAADADLDGRLLALDNVARVTLNNNDITPCSFGRRLPVHAPVKVTGGGQISVPNVDSSGRANYGFNARPRAESDASGHLNYLNHVSGLRVNGEVTDLDVVTLNADGSPDAVRFSGTCRNSATCTFSVVVEDNGEPAVDDRFGIVVVGSEADESTASRVVNNGNIQLHLGLTTTVNSSTFRAGDVMNVDVSVTPGREPPLVDAYLVLRLPGGELLSWTGSGFAAGIVPIAQNVRPRNFRSVVARFAIPAGVPPGRYTWLSATTAAGTLHLVSEIAERHFTIAR